MKKKTKKQEGGFLEAMMALMVASLMATMASSLIQLVASSLANVITGKGVIREGKGQEGGFFPFISIVFNDESYDRKRYNKMDHIDKRRNKKSRNFCEMY